MSKIVVLTGAGISAESGIPTFRGDGGLWEGHRFEDVATPQAFERDPALVHRFYNERRNKLLSAEVEPNEGHKALVRLEEALADDLFLVTQNIDNLHERAGSKRVLHMHGELLRASCIFCSNKMEMVDDLSPSHDCPFCQRSGGLRPDIVWFGEFPYGLDETGVKLQHCSVFIAIGTSGHVYPAAGFVKLASRAHKIEVNLEPTPVQSLFDETLKGKAGEVLPALVDRLIEQYGTYA